MVICPGSEVHKDQGSAYLAKRRISLPTLNPERNLPYQSRCIQNFWSVTFPQSRYPARFWGKIAVYEEFTLSGQNHLQLSKIFLIYHITLNYPNLWVNPLVKSGVLEPNNRVKSQILAFTPILTTGGGCHSNGKHDNHPESSIIW